MLGRAPREPGPLALIMLVYLVAMLIGMSLYGVDPWVRNADGFGVLFSADRLARRRSGAATTAKFVLRVPVHRRRRGWRRSSARARCWSSRSARPRSTAPRRAPLFNDLAKDLQSFFRDLGVGIGPALELGFIVGLAGAMAIVGAIWALGMHGMRAAGAALDRGRSRGRSRTR